MSTEDEAQGPQSPYTITLKGGAGYDAPWLVLRAESAEDALALLAEAAVADLGATVAEHALSFQEKYSASNGGGEKEKPAARGGARGGSRGGSSKPAGRGSRESSGSNGFAEEDLDPEGRTCDKRGCDGNVYYKEISSRGKTYELYVCEFQKAKGDGHFSEFIN